MLDGYFWLRKLPLQLNDKLLIYSRHFVAILLPHSTFNAEQNISQYSCFLCFVGMIQGGLVYSVTREKIFQEDKSESVCMFYN